MIPLSFYPGPSKVHERIPEFIQEAVLSGILGQNHRSKAFIEIYESCVKALKQQLNIPDNYTVLFTSSATECWEIISQSVVDKGSVHIYNGAFGKKWAEYTDDITSSVRKSEFGINEFPGRVEAHAGELICLTHCETSNATMLPASFLQAVRLQNPGNLIAIDATSSLAGVEIDFALADIWFASVQKCFGLPAGMAVMICSDRVAEKVKTLNERKHYNSLAFMLEMAEKFQTTYTPNVLAIYLLKRVSEASQHIKSISPDLIQRKENWESFLSTYTDISFLVENEALRATTVLALKANPEIVKEIKRKATEKGIILGNGYGAWADHTFRIANFPAHSAQDISYLQDFLQNFLS